MRQAVVVEESEMPCCIHFHRVSRCSSIATSVSRFTTSFFKDIVVNTKASQTVHDLTVQALVAINHKSWKVGWLVG